MCKIENIASLWLWFYFECWLYDIIYKLVINDPEINSVDEQQIREVPSGKDLTNLEFSIIWIPKCIVYDAYKPKDCILPSVK